MTGRVARMRDRSPKRRKHALIWKLTLGVLATPFVLGYGYVWWDFQSAANSYDQELARAKAHGLGFELADMKVEPAVSDADNAAPLYKQIWADWDESAATSSGGSFAEAQRDLLSDDPAKSRAAEQTFRDLNPLIERIFEASQKPGCDFHRDWRQGFALLFPELARYKEGVKALQGRALISARHGDFDSAKRDVLASGRVARHAGTDPTLISGLVYVACDAITLRTLAHLGAIAKDDPARLAELKALIDQLPASPDATRYLKGEAWAGHYGCLNAADQIKDLTAFVPGDSPSFPRVPLFWPGLNKDMQERAYAARYLLVWNNALDEAGGTSDLIKLGTELERATPQVSVSKRLPDVLPAILLPVFAQAGRAFKRVDLNRETHKAWFNVMFYHAKNGRYPKTLAEAGPVPIDTFSGKPICYKLTDEGFMVYSVGDNGKDDGGSSEPGIRDHPLVKYPVVSTAKPSQRASGSQRDL